MSRETNVCVIMPAFNEAESVAEVIKQVHQHLPSAQVVVINDGSTDATADVAAKAGAQVVTMPFNLGIGGAVQTGLKYALANGYEVALELDADGQHDPAYAQTVVDGLADEQAEVVIGSRFVSDTAYRSSVLRRFGIHVFSFLIKVVTKQRIYDSTSGYRAYSRRAMKFLSRQYPSDFPEPESIVMLLNAGMKVVEVPVRMGGRVAGTSVVGRDLSLKAAYFVLSNAVAIVMNGFKTKQPYVE